MGFAGGARDISIDLGDALRILQTSRLEGLARDLAGTRRSSQASSIA